MSERVLSLQVGGAYTIAESAAEAVLGTRSGDAARVFLYLTLKKGRCSDQSLCADLGLTSSALTDAIAILQSAGLLSAASVQGQALHLASEERPDYSSRELAAAIEPKSDFYHVLEEAQRKLGKIISGNDLKTLFGLYDWRGLSPGVISLLLNYCIEETAARWGSGRLPTLRQIDKQAQIWEQEGLYTEEDAERYIVQREESRKTAASMVSVLGIGGRALSSTEKSYITQWAGMGFSADAIALAYDRTVIKTGKLSWKYMNAILTNWKDSGLLEAEEIEREEAAHLSAKQSGNDSFPAQRRQPAAQCASAPRQGSASPPDRTRDRAACARLKQFVDG